MHPAATPAASAPLSPVRGRTPRLLLSLLPFFPTTLTNHVVFPKATLLAGRGTIFLSLGDQGKLFTFQPRGSAAISGAPSRLGFLLSGDLFCRVQPHRLAELRLGCRAHRDPRLDNAPRDTGCGVPGLTSVVCRPSGTTVVGCPLMEDSKLWFCRFTRFALTGVKASLRLLVCRDTRGAQQTCNVILCFSLPHARFMYMFFI